MSKVVSKSLSKQKTTKQTTENPKPISRVLFILERIYGSFYSTVKILHSKFTWVSSPCPHSQCECIIHLKHSYLLLFVLCFSFFPPFWLIFITFVVQYVKHLTVQKSKLLFFFEIHRKSYSGKNYTPHPFQSVPTPSSLPCQPSHPSPGQFY